MAITLLLATRNRHKARELARLLKKAPVRLVTLDRFPEIPPVAEEGSTFLANAVKKAVFTSRHTILPVLAEDSGLQVNALRGKPGVHSARFAGPDQNDATNIAKLLRLMKGVPSFRRQARFVCCLGFAIGGKLIRTFQGNSQGSIALQPKGRGGFGYDPVFLPKGLKKTFGQLPGHLKDTLSHRSKAVARFSRWLQKTGTKTGTRKRGRP